MEPHTVDREKLQTWPISASEDLLDSTDFRISEKQLWSTVPSVSNSGKALFCWSRYEQRAAPVLAYVLKEDIKQTHYFEDPNSWGLAGATAPYCVHPAACVFLGVPVWLFTYTDLLILKQLPFHCQDSWTKGIECKSHCILISHHFKMQVFHKTGLAASILLTQSYKILVEKVSVLTWHRPLILLRKNSRNIKGL